MENAQKNNPESYARRSTKDQDNWERIDAVIKFAGMTTNGFAKHIGLPRGENLYQIKRGNNGVSLDVAARICQHFPSIDKLWLLTGEGQMIRNDAPAGPWSNTGTPNSEAFRAWAAVQLLPVFIEKGSPDPAAAALDQVDKLLEQLAKKGGKQ